MREVILGIDPGQSGGIAVLGFDAPCAYKMPETERDLWDFLWDFLKGDGGDEYYELFAYLEAVHSMPKQGISSTFKFGQHYGMLRGMLIAAGVPFEIVSPAKWQGKLGCRSKGDKNVTKAKAQELFPTLKVTHATADALLIAEYGRRMRGGL